MELTSFCRSGVYGSISGRRGAVALRAGRRSSVAVFPAVSSQLPIRYLFFESFLSEGAEAPCLPSRLRIRARSTSQGVQTAGGHPWFRVRLCRRCEVNSWESVSAAYLAPRCSPSASRRRWVWVPLGDCTAAFLRQSGVVLTALEMRLSAGVQTRGTGEERRRSL